MDACIPSLKRPQCDLCARLRTEDWAKSHKTESVIDASVTVRFMGTCAMLQPLGGVKKTAVLEAVCGYQGDLRA